MKFLKTKFISEEGEKNLLIYKYEGSDSSIYNNYIIDPLA